MRRNFFPIIIFLSICIGGALVVLNTTWLISKYAPKWLSTSFKDISLLSFSCEKQSYQYPYTLNLFDVEIDFKYQEEIYQVSIPKITIHDCKTIWENHQAKVSLRGLNLKSQKFILNSFDFKLLLSLTHVKPYIITQLDSVFRGGIIKIAQYQFFNIAGQLKGNHKQIELKELIVDAFGGELKGQFIVESIRGLSYVLWLELFNGKPEHMVSINQAAFSQIKGSINGTLRVIGKGDNVDIFALNFIGEKEMIIGPELAAEVISWVHEEEEKELLQFLQDPEGKIFLNNVTFNLRKINHNLATLNLKLEDDEDFTIKLNKNIPVKQGFNNLLLRQTEKPPVK